VENLRHRQRERGGEFGEEWHRAGTRENKQNVFDDFIAAGEWLISEGYTRGSKLGCFGWSNGGLSVNAVAVQRPDLWKAVVAGAPVTDMARFHLAHGARHWIADYGSPEDPHDLNFLMQYSLITRCGKHRSSRDTDHRSRQ